MTRERQTYGSPGRRDAGHLTRAFRAALIADRFVNIGFHCVGLPQAAKSSTGQDLWKGIVQEERKARLAL